MALEQDNEELDKKENDLKKMRFINAFVPVTVFVTVIVCICMFGLVIKLDRRIYGLEESIKTLQVTDSGYLITQDAGIAVSDIDGNAVDETEAADIAKVEALESKLLWNDIKDHGTGVKRVYLTFDDGPSANTDKILDILDKYGVKATFFVVGKDNYTAQYKRIVEDGHTLGMHSYSHKYNEIYASLDAYRNDLIKLHDFLYEITGVDCNIVRFPGGSSNTISDVDMHDLTAYLEEQNMIYFDWNVSSGDASGNYRNANQIADNVLENIDKYNNAIILFHDAAGKSSTVDALPIIIEKILESNDTVFLPISEDTVRVQHLH